MSKAPTKFGVGAHADESVSKKVRPSWGDEQSFFGVGDELGNAADGRGDDGEANAHRLHERHRQALVVRSQNKDIGSDHEPQDVVTLTEERESITEAESSMPLVQFDLERSSSH